MMTKFFRTGMFAALLLAAAACNDQTVKDFTANAYTSFSPALQAEMARKKMSRESPILGRIFKEEGKLEIWKQTSSGRFAIIASYDICKYSGKLGPKYTEGDRQAPEGFYTVRPAQMNPNSRYTLAFNLGYPNAYDRANGRSGANLMVHGACSSSGCYSMTDPQMTQIFAFAAEAFKGGQREFQIQAFPFRMTAQNMARYRNDPNYPFWKMIKEGYDAFEISKTPPRVDVCEKRYVFNRRLTNGTTLSATGACPAPDTSASAAAYQSYQKGYEAAFESAVTKSGTPPAKPSIRGADEAKLVADWTKRRARGERIPIDPPTLTADGKVVATGRMGRANTEAGRRMAALEAAEAEKKRVAEAKAAAETAEKERKQAEKAAQELALAEERNAKEAARKALAEAKAQPSSQGTVDAIAADEAEGKSKAKGKAKAAEEAAAASEMPPPPPPPEEGMLNNLRKKATGALGSLLGG
ncbi:MAG TPA: murein L,D-transpeptidase family protein [Mesorhizobium sp.]